MEVYAVKILDITNEQLNTLSLLIDTKKEIELKNL
ncbi:hypothetical protein SAMN04488574_102319 [Bacillus sp. 71mf]|nr:hypothetical protein SAMN04488574_102319 [Bacillus sp. 71mf]SFS37542.1 hypothetical protein SAMN04488145_101146 [Bacillus sp. 103mf]